jgi:uncharacterized protein (UPF0548 family)
VTHHRLYLGDGDATFARARDAIQRWAMFDPSWITVVPAAAPIRVDTTVALVVRYLGVWSLNACRIVYVVDERDTVERFGFAYGTVPAHGVQGEERFLVEWNHTDDAVTYDLRAVSRPGSLLARLGGPLVRRLQRQFARDSRRAMLWAVQR